MQKCSTTCYGPCVGGICNQTLNTTFSMQSLYPLVSGVSVDFHPASDSIILVGDEYDQSVKIYSVDSTSMQLTLLNGVGVNASIAAAVFISDLSVAVAYGSTLDVYTFSDCVNFTSYSVTYSVNYSAPARGGVSNFSGLCVNNNGGVLLAISPQYLLVFSVSDGGITLQLQIVNGLAISSSINSISCWSEYVSEYSLLTEGGEGNGTLLAATASGVYLLGYNSSAVYIVSQVSSHSAFTLPVLQQYTLTFTYNVGTQTSQGYLGIFNSSSPPSVNSVGGVYFEVYGYVYGAALSRVANNRIAVVSSRDSPSYQGSAYVYLYQFCSSACNSAGWQCTTGVCLNSAQATGGVTLGNLTTATPWSIAQNAAGVQAAFCDCSTPQYLLVADQLQGFRLFVMQPAAGYTMRLLDVLGVSALGTPSGVEFLTADCTVGIGVLAGGQILQLSLAVSTVTGYLHFSSSPLSLFNVSQSQYQGFTNIALSPSKSAFLLSSYSNNGGVTNQSALHYFSLVTPPPSTTLQLVTILNFTPTATPCVKTFVSDYSVLVACGTVLYEIDLNASSLWSVQEVGAASPVGSIASLVYSASQQLGVMCAGSQASASGSGQQCLYF